MISLKNIQSKELGILSQSIFIQQENVELEFEQGTAVIMEKKRYENLLENIYIAANPEIMKRIKNRKKSGKKTYESIDQILNDMES